MRVFSLAVAFAVGNGCASFANAQLAEPMIVGGRPAEVGRYPYFVDMDGCGASLIAPGVVLSAAHCVDFGTSYVGESVIVGGIDRQQVTNGAISETVTNQIVHPSWDTYSGMDYDIMLFKLATPVTTRGSVRLGLNSQFSTPTDGEVLTIIGNGNTVEGGFQSDVLLEAEVRCIGTDICNEPYQGEVVDSTMFCAGAKGKDTCQGDSGGPIVIVDGDTHTQVGVVSWGYGCSRPGIPGVYARVSNVMNWIAYVTCTCWGVDDAEICSYLDSNDNFSCEDTLGERPNDVGVGPSGCEIIAGWVDQYGDGCGWFEAYDGPGCPETGFVSGLDGYTASEACCHCQSSSEPAGCLVIDGWIDSVGDSCDWYEANDSPGCPNFGSITGNPGGATAWEACCHCEGGGSGSGGGSASGCELVSGWTDFAGDGCDWYEVNDSPGCPFFGDFEGSNGVLAWDACCHCEGGGGGGGGGSDPGCELVSDWVDIASDDCRWYELNDSQGCPTYGYIEGTGGVQAWDACCHCEGGRPEPGCQLVDGWIDASGDSCAWYEQNDSPGCPNYGSIGGINSDANAWQACCHCEGGGGAGCELVAGWLDDAGDPCLWYEQNDLPGCPNFGDIPGTGGVLAWDACCHCEGGTAPPTGVACELVPGWTDDAGDPCSWYEANDEPGCPVYGSFGGSAGGTDNIAAWDACCHCQGGRPNTDPGCQLVEGWTDFAGDSCAWYEDNDAAGCPEYGNTEGTNGIPAWQACCHCGGNDGFGGGTDDGLGGFLPTDRPTPTPFPTYPPTPELTPPPTPSPTPGPTPGPTPDPTPGPTPIPTALPSSNPTMAPVVGPTPEPTPGPTPSPTISSPTQTPVSGSTVAPVVVGVDPTAAPVLDPTTAPIRDVDPTTAPVVIDPTQAPNVDGSPTVAPADTPTEAPVTDGGNTGVQPDGGDTDSASRWNVLAVAMLSLLSGFLWN